MEASGVQHAVRWHVHRESFALIDPAGTLMALIDTEGFFGVTSQMMLASLCVVEALQRQMAFAARLVISLEGHTFEFVCGEVRDNRVALTRTLSKKVRAGFGVEKAKYIVCRSSCVGRCPRRSFIIEIGYGFQDLFFLCDARRIKMVTRFRIEKPEDGGQNIYRGLRTMNVVVGGNDSPDETRFLVSSVPNFFGAVIIVDVENG
jgi:hypothetical protein